jgi:hypothetical protein
MPLRFFVATMHINFFQEQIDYIGLTHLGETAVQIRKEVVLISSREDSG